MAALSGKVAFITGAARGQGRSHAVKLAEAGADIIAIDVCADIDTVPYSMATASDKDETVRLVEVRGRRILFEQADVRDLSGMEKVVATGVAEFGRLDIVCANAGIAGSAAILELSEDKWQTMIDINLTGVWKTVKAAVPAMIAAGNGGSIILTSSIAGLVAFPNLAHYSSAKHGVTGLMRALAIELAGHGIRVNSVHPTNVDTDMVNNPTSRKLLLGLADVTHEEAVEALKRMHMLPVPWIESIDVSNLVLWLASDESRYITGTTQVIDAGATAPFKLPHPAS